MKDFRGIKLEVGDKVAVLPPQWRNMVEGVIEKFTAKQATIVYKPWNGSMKDRVETTSRASEFIAFLERPKPIQKAVIDMVKNIKKTRIPLVDPKGKLKALEKMKIKPKVDHGQFTGGIESRVYIWEENVFSFFIEDGEIIEAYMEWKEWKK